MPFPPEGRQSSPPTRALWRTKRPQLEGRVFRGGFSALVLFSLALSLGPPKQWHHQHRRLGTPQTSRIRSCVQTRPPGGLRTCQVRESLAGGQMDNLSQTVVTCPRRGQPRVSSHSHPRSHTRRVLGPKVLAQPEAPEIPGSALSHSGDLPASLTITRVCLGTCRSWQKASPRGPVH